MKDMNENIAEQDKEAASEIIEAIEEGNTSLPYRPLSTCPPVDTVAPIGMASEITAALNELAQKVGDIDRYVMSKLGYSSKTALCEAFSGEQVDAIALAISQFERGNGMVLADMAGIGKGRICAGIMRYAYYHGKIPFFITVTPNLFSDNYRDIDDIGGFISKEGRKFMPKPFIMNGRSSRQQIKVVDPETGKKRTEYLPGETSIVDLKNNPTVALFEGLQDSENFDIWESNMLPEEYNYIVSTYSQYQTSKEYKGARLRKSFTEAVAPNSIFILDECHNVAGEGVSGKFFRSISKTCHAVLFSSATFAKNPDNMALYSYRTDIKSSGASDEAIVSAIKDGGIEIQEYIAMGMARSGQLIRRERSFKDCNFGYNYTPQESEPEFNAIYDEVVGIYNRFAKIVRSKGFKDSKDESIERFARLHGVSLADEYDPNSDEDGDRAEWKRRNQGRYVARFDAGSMPSRFQFIEALLFGLKVKSVADIAVKQYTDRTLVNKDVKGNEFQSNRKVIIGVRDTLESVYSNSGLKNGNIIESNDFSMFFKAFVSELLFGTISLTKVVLSDKKEATRLVDDNWEISSDDFISARRNSTLAEYKQEAEKVKGINIKIPASPIDALKEAIESADRPDWDDPKNKGPKLRVGEITGRSMAIIKTDNGLFTYAKARQDKSAAIAFSKFNDGDYDVLIINTSGSTGASAHASSKFKDSRPRAMIMHQIELDVNIEVQKRGRVNRTGQISYPTYIYACTRIPIEVRRLLMLAKKLQSLDSLTSANRAQQAKTTQFKDASDNEIHDWANKYGNIVVKGFLEEDEHGIYLTAFLNTRSGGKASTAERALASQELASEFMSSLELLPVRLQRYAFDEINRRYASLKADLIEQKQFDLEVTVIDFNSKTKTRLIASPKTDNTFFGATTYIEDNYSDERVKTYTRQYVDKMVGVMAKNMAPDEYHASLIAQMKQFWNLPTTENPTPKEGYYSAYMAKTFPTPTIPTGATDEEVKAIMAEWKEKRDNGGRAFADQCRNTLRIVEALTPRKGVKLPEDPRAVFKDTGSGGGNISLPVLGKVLGIKVHTGPSENIYTASNIEIVFATLNGMPKMAISPTNANVELLNAIIAKPPIGSENGRISEWVVGDKAKRVIFRAITGNLMRGIAIAEQLIADTRKAKDPNGVSGYQFAKWTAYGSKELRTGIILRYGGLNTTPVGQLKPESFPRVLSLLDEGFIDMLKRTLIEKYQAHKASYYKLGKGRYSNDPELDLYSFALDYNAGNTPLDNKLHLLNSDEESQYTETVKLTATISHGYRMDGPYLSTASRYVGEAIKHSDKARRELTVEALGHPDLNMDDFDKYGVNLKIEFLDGVFPKKNSREADKSKDKKGNYNYAFVSRFAEAFPTILGMNGSTWNGNRWNDTFVNVSKTITDPNGYYFAPDKLLEYEQTKGIVISSNKLASSPKKPYTNWNSAGYASVFELRASGVKNMPSDVALEKAMAYREFLAKVAEKDEDSLRFTHLYTSYTTLPLLGALQFIGLKKFLTDSGLNLTFKITPTELGGAEVVDEADYQDDTTDSSANAEEAVGEYPYYLIRQFSEESMPKEYIKGSLQTNDPLFRKGKVLLNKNISPLECSLYGMAPISPSYSDIIKRLLSHVDEIRRGEFRFEISQAIKQGSDNFDLAVMAERDFAYYFGSMQYVIGNSSMDSFGEALRLWADGKIGEFGDKKATAGTEPDEDTPDSIPLTLESADDFVNLLNRAIKR